MKRPEGYCHVCGNYGPLSWEHVPPKKAFNNERVFSADSKAMLEDTLNPHRFSNPKGDYVQGGAGAYTLCMKCNNDTGSWYGTSYINWAKQGYQQLAQHQTQPLLELFFDIYPSRVLKEILCMFASACPPGIISSRPELQKFILDRDEQSLPPDIRVFCFLMSPKSWASRQSGVTGVLDGSRGGADIRSFSEIVFKPFGYILLLQGTPLDPVLQDITFFANHLYQSRRQLHLKLPVREIHSPFPGDYRTKAEMLSDAANDRALDNPFV